MNRIADTEKNIVINVLRRVNKTERIAAEAIVTGKAHGKGNHFSFANIQQRLSMITADTLSISKRERRNFSRYRCHAALESASPTPAPSSQNLVEIWKKVNTG